MKAQYQIVGAQQYEYIMIEDDVLTQEEAVEKYNSLKEAFRGSNLPVGDGLDPKEYNRCVEEYLTTGSLIDGTNLYEKMSPSQQEWFQITKRGLKRIKAKE